MSESPSVTIDRREKIFPQEDFEFEGSVNGKEFTATQVLGHGASVLVDTPRGTNLTTEEEQAVVDYIWDNY